MCEGKFQGHIVALTSYWLTSLPFNVNWPSHSWDTEFLQNLIRSRSREIWLPSFVMIWRVVLILSWRQGKLLTTSVAVWPWPKVTSMAAKKIPMHINHVRSEGNGSSFNVFPRKFSYHGGSGGARELDQNQKLLWPLLLTRFNFNPSMDK